MYRINDIYATESTELIVLLEDVDSIAITANLWTSIAHNAYLGVTAHFVTQDCILQTKLLDCIEMAADEHTAKDIAALLTERFTFINATEASSMTVTASSATDDDIPHSTEKFNGST